MNEMEDEKVFNTLLTIHAPRAAFIHDPANAQFLVTEDLRGPYGAQSPVPDLGSREGTPIVQHLQESKLRITTDFLPNDPHAGFIFGSDSDCCDVLLARGSDHGISKRHFAILFSWEHEAIILKNLSRNRTKLTKHMVRIRDVLYGTPPSLVMELVWGGCDLAESTKVQPINAPDAQLCLKQLLLAVESLHSSGFIHRDIRPSNVMVVSRDPLHVKLTGLGLASYGATRRSHGGCVPYAAPEVVANAPYTNNIDIWAIGMMALECVESRAPMLELNGQLERLRKRFASANGFFSFIKDLLTERPPASDCLKHAFFSEELKRTLAIRGQFLSKEQPIPVRVRPGEWLPYHEAFDVPGKRDIARLTTPSDVYNDNMNSDALWLDTEYSLGLARAVEWRTPLETTGEEHQDGDADALGIGSGPVTPRPNKKRRADLGKGCLERAFVRKPDPGRKGYDELLKQTRMERDQIKNWFDKRHRLTKATDNENHAGSRWDHL
ncbi:hypothetical protein LQW54_010651 [Pestalotiopsis sp. IQ-011]